MTSFEKVLPFLSLHGIVLAGEIVSNPNITGGLIIPISFSRDGEGKPRPSHKILSDLKNELTAIGVHIDYLLVDRESKSIEDGLRGSLITSFPALVRNSFVTVESGVAHVWLDGKKDPTEADHQKIRSLVQRYIEISSLRGFDVHFISEEQVATNTEVLSVIRRVSPVGCDDLRSYLQEAGFSVPSLEWINKKFDALRKAGLVVRLSDRTYVLTYEALHRLGTRKTRRSPDVGRLLALARRGG